MLHPLGQACQNYVARQTTFSHPVTMGAQTSLGHNRAETERKSSDLGHFKLGGFEHLRKREMPVIQAVLALAREISALGS